MRTESALWQIHRDHFCETTYRQTYRDHWREREWRTLNCNPLGTPTTTCKDGVGGVESEGKGCAEEEKCGQCSSTSEKKRCKDVSRKSEHYCCINCLCDQKQAVNTTCNHLKTKSISPDTLHGENVDENNSEAEKTANCCCLEKAIIIADTLNQDGCSCISCSLATRPSSSVTVGSDEEKQKMSRDSGESGEDASMTTTAKPKKRVHWGDKAEKREEGDEKNMKEEEEHGEGGKAEGVFETKSLPQSSSLVEPLVKGVEPVTKTTASTLEEVNGQSVDNEERGSASHDDGDVIGESPAVPPLSAMLHVSGTRVPHRLGLRFKTQAHTRYYNYIVHYHPHHMLSRYIYVLYYNNLFLGQCVNFWFNSLCPDFTRCTLTPSLIYVSRASRAKSTSFSGPPTRQCSEDHEHHMQCPCVYSIYIMMWTLVCVCV